jgi:hypothetical protein
MGRLFYLLPTILGWIVMASMVSAAQTPALTTISDIVYRADGTLAGGTLLISWPAFTTADGHAIAAGNTSTVLGTGGALAVQLVPNASATPPNTFYTVVYQLDSGVVECLNSSAWAKTSAPVKTQV